MKNNFKSLLLIVGIAVLGSAFAPVTSVKAQEADKSKESSVDGVLAAQLEKVRRQEALQSAQMKLKEAAGLVKDGEYAKAMELYRECAKLVGPSAPASSGEIAEIQNGSVLCLYHLAIKSYEAGELGTASRLVKEAAELDPTNREVITLQQKVGEASTTAEEKKRIAEEEQAKIPPEISNQDFVSKQKEVLELYRAAENYYKSEQFDQAEATFKKILKIDPYSATAYHRLRETQLAKHRKLNSAIQQTEAEGILEVQNAWRLPIGRDQSAVKPIPNNVQIDDNSTGVRGKLSKITIKKVEFQDTPIVNAINYLINESREADPNKEGVNIILALQKQQVGTDGKPFTEAPPPGADANAGVDASAGPTVTLNLRNTPLLQVIKFITTTTGLKYKIENDAVIITHGWEGDYQTRIFNVDPSVFRTVIDRDSNIAGGAAGGGGGFAAVGAGGGGTTTRRADVKEEFKNFGIEFPPGTSISYNEALGIIVARHTTEVLEQIEQIIIRLNKTPAQVQIEAKFIDVKQSTLDELGFRYAFGDASQKRYTIESGQGTSLENLPIGGPYLGLGQSMTSGLRNSTSISASALDTLLTSGSGFLTAGGANTLLTITGILTNPQFQVMIDALAQKGLTNLLSAPKVTTTSGETAKILVTREFIFPSSYTDPQVQVATGAAAGSGVGVIGPSPSAFSTREIGVILEVRPNVSNDKYTINLTLSPEVIDFEGFIPYTSSALAGGTAFTFVQQQPIFNKRTVTTSVTIWDGQTVLLGGLIRDDVVKVNDKLPILGDIPLVGRLFQSKVENDVKRNLMIFLTARIVDPAGNPVRRFESQGAIPTPNVE